MMRRIAAAMATMALAVLPMAALADGADQALEQLAVEMASTPAQHQALAKYFEARADEARAEASRHESMAKTYAATKTSQRAEMRRHCDALVKEYTEMAKQFDALAELHKKEAMGGK